MKMSEKFKIEEEEKIFRRRSLSYLEERFFQMTKILDFAAICNKKRFSEWTHPLPQIRKSIKLPDKGWVSVRFSPKNWA